MKFLIGFFAAPALILLVTLIVCFAILPILIWYSMGLPDNATPGIINLVWLMTLLGLSFHFDKDET